jgi:hypothetical protein
LENPGNDIDTGQVRVFDPTLANSVKGDEKVPDLTAQLRCKGGWGHVQVAGIGRYVGYETVGTPENKPRGHDLGWGVDLTSVINLRKKDAVRAGVVFGRGIASYMNDGGMDLAPTGSTTTAINTEAVPLVGVSAYYDLWWNDRWSSSAGYSITQVRNTDFQTPDAYHSGQYVSANLLHYPTKNVFYGIEYLYGRREDNDGDFGEDNRVQISAHYKFSSKDFSSN